MNNWEKKFKNARKANENAENLILPGKEELYFVSENRQSTLLQFSCYNIQILHEMKYEMKRADLLS